MSNWAFYDRIVREKVKETSYNLKISEQKHKQDKAAHEAALKELATWENGLEEKFKQMERV